MKYDSVFYNDMAKMLKFYTFYFQSFSYKDIGIINCYFGFFRML